MARVGKTKLVYVISLIATGRKVARSACPATDEEWDKRLLAIALAGTRLVLFDNLSTGGNLGSPSLDAALTGSSYAGRILGETAWASDIPFTTIMYASRQQMQLIGDITGRVVFTRMESRVDRPEERADFRVPDLLGHVRATRGELAVAALTILRGSWSPADRHPIRRPPLWASTRRGRRGPARRALGHRTRTVATRELARSCDRLAQSLPALSSAGTGCARPRANRDSPPRRRSTCHGEPAGPRRPARHPRRAEPRREVAAAAEIGQLPRADQGSRLQGLGHQGKDRPRGQLLDGDQDRPGGARHHRDRRRGTGRVSRCRGPGSTLGGPAGWTGWTCGWTYDKEVHPPKCRRKRHFRPVGGPGWTPFANPEPKQNFEFKSRRDAGSGGAILLSTGNHDHISRLSRAPILRRNSALNCQIWSTQSTQGASPRLTRCMGGDSLPHPGLLVADMRQNMVHNRNLLARVAWLLGGPT